MKKQFDIRESIEFVDGVFTAPVAGIYQITENAIYLIKKTEEEDEATT